MLYVWWHFVVRQSLMHINGPMTQASDKQHHHWCKVPNLQFQTYIEFRTNSTKSSDGDAACLMNFWLEEWSCPSSAEAMGLSYFWQLETSSTSPSTSFRWLFFSILGWKLVAILTIGHQKLALNVLVANREPGKLSSLGYQCSVQTLVHCVVVCTSKKLKIPKPKCWVKLVPMHT